MSTFFRDIFYFKKLCVNFLFLKLQFSVVRILSDSIRLSPILSKSCVDFTSTRFLVHLNNQMSIIDFDMQKLR